jgi:hypothetical protein
MTRHCAALQDSIVPLLPPFGRRVFAASITSRSHAISGTAHAIAESFQAISTSSRSDPKESATQTPHVRDLRRYTTGLRGETYKHDGVVTGSTPWDDSDRVRHRPRPVRGASE